MTQVNVLYWNLGGVNQQRLAQAGPSYTDLIASVMRAGNIAVAGFSGVLAGLGGLLGQAVVDNLGSTAWIQQASPPLGQGRNEQYVFVWNLQAVPAYKPPGLEYWLWQYPRPGQQGRYFGFPRQQDQSPDMPPFTMFFRLGNSNMWMPMAILHAPPWAAQGHGQEIAGALASFAQVPAFDLGSGALLMGTFNVPADDNVNTPGSNGATVFGGLAGAQGKYDQAMNNHRTALAAAPVVAIVNEQAYAQTSDNFFLRRNSPQGGITGSAPGILPVISSSLGSVDDQSEDWHPAPFRPALAVVEAACAGRQNVAAGDDGSYDAFDDAFAVYRLYVSDHVPIIMTINY